MTSRPSRARATAPTPAPGRCWRARWTWCCSRAGCWALCRWDPPPPRPPTHTWRQWTVSCRGEAGGVGRGGAGRGTVASHAVPAAPATVLLGGSSFRQLTMIGQAAGGSEGSQPGQEGPAAAWASNRKRPVPACSAATRRRGTRLWTPGWWCGWLTRNMPTSGGCRWVGAPGVSEMGVCVGGWSGGWGKGGQKVSLTLLLKWAASRRTVAALQRAEQQVQLIMCGCLAGELPS